MKEITSRENQWVRMAHSLKKKKGRQEQSRFLAEGFRLLSDAIQVGVMDGICFVTEKGMHHEGFDTFLSRGETLGWTFFHVTDSVYDKIKDTGNPQGMAAMLPLFTTVDIFSISIPAKSKISRLQSHFLISSPIVLAASERSICAVPVSIYTIKSSKSIIRTAFS